VVDHPVEEGSVEAEAWIEEEVVDQTGEDVMTGEIDPTKSTVSSIKCWNLVTE